MSEFHTDALRPSSLPTASLGRRLPTSTTGTDKDADAEFDKVAEEWNLRIDKEMKNLTGGLGELVELADITPNPSTTQITTLHLKLKTSQLIRSAQSIRDIAHELKLMLLLSDQGNEVRERDREAGEVGKEVEEGRKGVAVAVSKLMQQNRAGHEGEEQSGMEEGGEMDIDTRNTESKQEDELMPKDQVEEDDEDEDEDEGFEQVA